MTKKDDPATLDTKKRLTMSDIARMAGVEKSTVSRALADSPRLPLKTKEKIRKIVKETGYVANHQARFLRAQKSGQILVMHDDIASLSFPELIQGIEETAGANKVSVLVGSSKDDERREAFGRLLLSGAVDGLILLAGPSPQCVIDHPKHERSVVSFSIPVPTSDIPSIAIDVAAATSTAIEHLLSLSHKKIALIAGPEGSPAANAHISAYKEMMEKAGLSDHIMIEETEGCGIDCGGVGMTRLLAAGHRPTAIFCTSDELAIGAMKKARRAGLTIPDDISFVGCNDLALAQAMDPPLTTIQIPLREMGRFGAKMLIENLDPARSMPENKIMPYELIVRDSCGPVKAS